MNRKIATYLGLSMALAVAVLAVIGAFSFMGQPGPVEARSSDGFGLNDGAFTLRNDLALAAPVAVAVSGVTGSVTPNTPGAAGRFEIKFTVSSTGNTVNLLNGTGTVIITFDDDFQVPNSINRNDVSISATHVAGGTGQPNVAVAPLDVAVDFVGPESDEGEVTLTVPDMDPSDGTGGDSIRNGATVTVLFRQAANIRNSTEGATRTVKVRTSTDVDDATLNLSIPILVELSAASGSRGASLTLLGRGYKDNTTVTFWRDADGDGVRDTGEIDLCSATVGADDTGTCTYSVTNPPFDPKTFGSGGSCTFGSVSDCNLINAIDGRANTSAITAANIANRIFNLLGSVTASPSTGNPGDTITVQLRDFPNEPLTSVQLGGEPITTLADGSTAITSQTVPATGDLNFNVKIPNGVATGAQSLDVATATSTTRRAIINVGGATVIPTPTTVVANQRISLIGTGFTGSSPAATVSSITIGGQPIAAARINDGNTVTIDAGGSWSASIDLPVNSATTTSGVRELKVTDSAARQGVVNLTFTERSVTVTPAETTVGSDITLTGTNFPAKNDEGTSITITVTYDAGGGGTTSTSATPDAGGNWSAILRVPSGAAIPSTNTIRATFTDDAGTSVITTVTHRVPRASIILAQTSGPAGTTVSLTATGFKRFTPINTLKVGTIDVTPAPKPATDTNGNVSFSFLIPGVETGVQTVELNVGGTTASAGFTVTAAGGPIIPPGGTQPPAQATQSLRDNNNNLVRVWNFNNQTKAWTFYDPRPAFEPANTLTQIASGAVYWIRVNTDQTATVGPCGQKSLFAGWNLVAC